MLSSWAPNSDTEARTGTPLAGSPDRVSSSTGEGCGSQGAWSCSTRAATLPEASPGSAMPETSPFMSATKQGTPASDRRPARPWTVLVLPVPVAPATSPCRFSMASGTATSKPVLTSSPLTARPSPTAGTSNV